MKGRRSSSLALPRLHKLAGLVLLQQQKHPQINPLNTALSNRPWYIRKVQQGHVTFHANCCVGLTLAPRTQLYNCLRGSTVKLPFLMEQLVEDRFRMLLSLFHSRTLKNLLNPEKLIGFCWAPPSHTHECIINANQVDGVFLDIHVES